MSKRPFITLFALLLACHAGVSASEATSGEPPPPEPDAEICADWCDYQNACYPATTGPDCRASCAAEIKLTWCSPCTATWREFLACAGEAHESIDCYTNACQAEWGAFQSCVQTNACQPPQASACGGSVGATGRLCVAADGQEGQCWAAHDTDPSECLDLCHATPPTDVCEFPDGVRGTCDWWQVTTPDGGTTNHKICTK